MSCMYFCLFISLYISACVRACVFVCSFFVCARMCAWMRMGVRQVGAIGFCAQMFFAGIHPNVLSAYTGCVYLMTVYLTIYIF